MIDSDVHISQKRAIMTQRCSVLVKAYWASKVENQNLRSAFYPSISSSWCRNNFPCLKTYSFMNASFLWGWWRGFCWCSMSSGCFLVLTQEVKVNPLGVILNERERNWGQMPQLPHLSVIQFHVRSVQVLERSTMDWALAVHTISSLVIIPTSCLSLIVSIPLFLTSKDMPWS